MSRRYIFCMNFHMVVTQSFHKKTIVFWLTNEPSNNKKIGMISLMKKLFFCNVVWIKEYDWKKTDIISGEG